MGHLKSSIVLLALTITSASNNLIEYHSNFEACMVYSKPNISRMSIRSAMMQVMVVAMLMCTQIVSSFHRRMGAIRSFHTSFNFPLLMQSDMKIGEFEDVKFSRISGSKALAKYAVSAVIKKAEMNSFLNEYKEELKRRKVVFPGFRAGKLPLYVMGDVRKYLVCFGLETMLGELCNLNRLQMCDEQGGAVPFGEDRYYEEIIQKDFRGYDYGKQRDSWREGTDFGFSAEFYAISEEEDETESVQSAIVDTEEVKQD